MNSAARVAWQRLARIMGGPGVEDAGNGSEDEDLAAKNVQDLILFNRPWPLNLPLPKEILSCASLTRLYIGVWHFPDISPGHHPVFPNLCELSLFHSIIKDNKFEALLAHCPKLNILSFAIAYNCPARPRIKSSSLRVVSEWICSSDKIIVEDAPCLERLPFESVAVFERRRPIKIVHVSRLEVLGVLDLQLHTLEIGGTVIKVRITMKDSVMLPSLKILVVKVRFSHDKEVKMLHPLLRCFPRLETLHIMSIRSSSPDSGDCAETWNYPGSADCLSHLKKFVLHGFHGLDREQLFVSYILEKGIKTLGIVYGDNDDVLVKRGLVPGSVGEGNAPSGGSSSCDSDDVVMEADPISCSVGGGNAPSGVNSGSVQDMFPIPFTGRLPCVEKQYIQSFLKNIPQNGTPNDPIDCLDLHLREIEIDEEEIKAVTTGAGADEEEEEEEDGGEGDEEEPEPTDDDEHHCQRCGGLFCSSCTQQRIVLRGQGASPVRICDPCQKLEEAARYELRYGHKNRAGKGEM
ncbi:hypothetical protein ZWY2020_043982 [Hordeum vulgare]|nr:hypothetical protein ZWY2020_043982 [Hordeum vulgare]